MSHGPDVQIGTVANVAVAIANRKSPVRFKSGLKEGDFGLWQQHDCL